jgi:hypothetical protein
VEDTLARLSKTAIGPFRICDCRDYIVVVNVQEWRVVCHVWKAGIESVADSGGEAGERAEIVFRMKRNKWSQHGGPITRQTVFSLGPDHVYEFITSVEKEEMITFKCDGFIYGQVEVTADKRYRVQPGDAVYETLTAAGDAILQQFTRAKNLDV